MTFDITQAKSQKIPEFGDITIDMGNSVFEWPTQKNYICLTLGFLLLIFLSFGAVLFFLGYCAISIGSIRLSVLIIYSEGNSDYGNDFYFGVVLYGFSTTFMFLYLSISIYFNEFTGFTLDSYDS